MIAIDEVRVVPHDGQHDRLGQPASSGHFSHYRHVAPLRTAIFRTRQWLLGAQHEEGYWVGELEGDTILESETILLLAYFGRHRSELAQQAARYLIEKQGQEGGWSLYPGGPVDVHGSVKAYFALKLTGHDPSEQYMVRARRTILRCGGADKVNSFTRFYLALLGQIPYDCCSMVPPQLMLLPGWCPFGLRRVSAWSRTMIVPLSIISARRPVRKIPAELGIRELFLEPPRKWPAPCRPGATGSRKERMASLFFRGLDRGLKILQKAHLLPFKRRAVARAERWMLDRFEQSDGLGAIFPPIVWSAIALDALGYAQDSEPIQYCFEQLERLVIREHETARLQPCKSPVWDTALSLTALAESGMDQAHAAARRAADWLLDKQCLKRGDWAASVDVQPGGWAFEFNNPFYPDLDDTAMVLLALRCQLEEARRPKETLPPELRLVGGRHSACRGGNSGGNSCSSIRQDRIRAAARRAIAWTLAMQNRDGGWGAFDRNNDSELLCQVPFADHNAMVDPSSPDVTARVLEALGAWGYELGNPQIDRAVGYLRQQQQADGSWLGRWGVNYVYGTWQALVGLDAVGVSDSDPMIAAGAHWLVAHQQACGGWGESPMSYADPSERGYGPVTASQTAWAVLGLIAAGQDRHPAVARGVRYLLDTQQPDGTWEETAFTGTGFPLVFYLRYHLYPVYFPLLALARWAQAVGHLLEEADAACYRLSGAAVPAGTRT